MGPGCSLQEALELTEGLDRAKRDSRSSSLARAVTTYCSLGGLAARGQKLAIELTKLKQAPQGQPMLPLAADRDRPEMKLLMV